MHFVGSNEGQGGATKSSDFESLSHVANEVLVLGKAVVWFDIGDTGEIIGSAYRVLVS